MGWQRLFIKEKISYIKQAQLVIDSHAFTVAVLALTDYYLSRFTGNCSHPHLNRWGIPAKLKVPKAPLHESIQLRIVPERESGLSEVRFWYEGELLGMQKVKNSDLNLVHF